MRAAPVSMYVAEPLPLPELTSTWPKSPTVALQAVSNAARPDEKVRVAEVLPETELDPLEAPAPSEPSVNELLASMRVFDVRVGRMYFRIFCKLPVTSVVDTP